MTCAEILTIARSIRLNLWLESRNGKLGIAYNDASKVRPLAQHIKANRDELIKLLKQQLPKPPKKICPGATRLELAIQWLAMNPSKDLIQLPTFLRWLAGWLSKSKQREWQLNTQGGDDGRLEWRDWEKVCQVVKDQFQSDLEASRWQ